MSSSKPVRVLRTTTLLLLVASLSGCASSSLFGRRVMSEHECMTRVMYFESNRSSPEGMLAVGTVVMNRVESKQYPNSVCAVVGQKSQFAPGVLTREMGKGSRLAAQMATKVLKGGRHSYVRDAKFFHTAGMTFPYTNMHYLVEAGGNVFYEKRKNARRKSDPAFVNPPGLEAANRAARVMLMGYQTTPAQGGYASAPVEAIQARAPQRLAPVAPRQPQAVPLPATPPAGEDSYAASAPPSAGDAMMEPISLDDVIAANGGF
ncbi:cell wall hydrolase [Jiella avicenniae]|uniref:Cell wall hydrolase n=1 Tax=Jiella avicenniae TaxID=2907202 RepID=A0A9X1T5U8_9HYPH|nr:cell wall hydrolase [Jiella avicenniae]MCE7029921.1 cell wall hydrolase [Jiella avicenniae]